MKITYFLTGIGLSGGPMTLYNFMNGLVKKGHEVFVVTLDDAFAWDFDTYKQYLHKKYPARNRQIFLYKFVFYANKFLQKIGTDIRLGKDKILAITDDFTKQYKKLGIDSDVFIATIPYSGDAVFKLGAGKKIVMHNQHFEELIFSDRETQIGVRELTRLPFNHIVNCLWLDRMFQYNYNMKCTVITPGMDHALFNAPLNPKKYTNGGTVKLITYCDRNRKFKGMKEQLQVFKKLYEKNQNIEIQFYGHDPKTDLFPYTFLGWISQAELAKHYAKSHLLLSFSWYESFPLPPIEAMASGCAVVAGKYGTEDYLKDGETGIVINPFKIDECTEKIDELIRNPKKMLELATAGGAMAKTFTWEAQVEKLDQFLKQLPQSKSVNITEIQNGNLDELNKIYL